LSPEDKLVQLARAICCAGVGRACHLESRSRRGAVGGRRHTALRPGPLLPLAAGCQPRRGAGGTPSCGNNPHKDQCGQRQHGEALAQPDLQGYVDACGRR